MNRETMPSELAMYDPMSRMYGGVASPWPVNGAAMGQNYAGEQTVWAIIDDRMRGRWRWAILLGIVLSAALAYLGYRSTSPIYRSIGAVRVAPHAPVILYQMPEHQTPDYHQHRATQVQLMQQPSLLKLALTHEELAKQPWTTQPGALSILKKGLTVEPDRDSHLIFVSFDSEDPATAQAVVNAVLWAYDITYAREGGIDLKQTLSQLKDRKAQLQYQLSGVRASQRAIIDKYQMTDLHELQRSLFAEISQRESQVSAGQAILARLEARANKHDKNAAAALPPTQRELEAVNPNLASLREQRDAAVAAFEAAKAKYFPGSRQWEILEQEARIKQQLFDEAMRKALVQWNTLGPEILLAQGSGFEGMTPEEMRAHTARLEASLAELRRRQEELTADIQNLDQLKDQEQQIRDELEPAIHRIEAFDMESKSLTSKINIEQRGMLPEEPAEDARGKRAIVGGVMGMMMSFGAFFLLGTLDRRAFGARQLDAVAGPQVPGCLGVLPDLSRTLSDPETADIASHCVHQIRNHIEAIREPDQGYVLAVTSPFQGDGKTSIVMALGWSYAAAGFNTLLIDCDLVGRSLTRQLGLVGREGLKEALIHRELDGTVSPLAVEHLSAVAVGIDPRFGPEAVRRSDIQRVLDDARQLYDIIIVDTGPMLGSLESTPVTASADGVVLSVRRGRSRTKLNECVARLNLVGTKCIGVILNCAARSDCNRYVSEASLAAAEEERNGRVDLDARNAIVQAIPGERNALVRAMQSAARFRENGP